MAGRKPTINKSKEIYKKSIDEIELQERLTPRYQKQEFPMPRSLNKEERKIWKWLVSLFHETIGCRVSDADVHLMELYCRAKAAADKADYELKANADAYIRIPTGELDKDGNEKIVIKPNPNIAKRKDNTMLCIKLFDQLGLSPIARARAGLAAANAAKEQSLYEKLNNRSDD